MGISMRELRVAQRSMGGTSQSKSCSICARGLSPSPAGRCGIHASTSGRQPSPLGSTYTMPQRLTVAGEATARSATS